MNIMYESTKNRDTQNPQRRKPPPHFAITGNYRATIYNHQATGGRIQQLRDEIARLKGQKPKPKIRPSKLKKDPKDQKKKDSSDKRPGSKKRSKTADLIIHKEIPVPPESIPPGSIFKEFQ